MINLTLGTDHAARKATRLVRGFLGYFLAAVAGCARHAERGNAQHNKGEPLHWARGKSLDHDECILRHTCDIADIEAWLDRNPDHPQRDVVVTMLEHEHDARVWRSCAASQTFYEKYRGAPLSPSSKLPPPPPEAFPGPINTPAEAAELERAQGTVRLVGMLPELAAGYGVPSGTVSAYPEVCGSGFPLFPDEPVATLPEESFERCAHMSRTKRVCVRETGHAGSHEDALTTWYAGE